MDWPVLPDYGIFDRWPMDGVGFIHPDDVATATRCIPSRRVLCRHHFDKTFYHYRYGKIQFRLRPAMWLKIRYEGIDIGDEVEVIGLGMEREQFVARIWGMHYVREAGQIYYRLKMPDDSAVVRLYVRDHLRLLTDKTKLKISDTVYRQPRSIGEKTDDTIPLE